MPQLSPNHSRNLRLKCTGISDITLPMFCTDLSTRLETASQWCINSVSV